MVPQTMILESGSITENAPAGMGLPPRMDLERSTRNFHLRLASPCDLIDLLNRP